MSEKVRNMTADGTVLDGDLFYKVGSGGGDQKITGAQMREQLSTSSLSQNPVENEYTTTAQMITDQGAQTTGFFQFVSTGNQYYEKLSTNSSSINDYRLLTASETSSLLTSNEYKNFTIEVVTPDSSPVNEVSRQQIALEYDSASNLIDGIVFNATYSTIISNILAEEDDYTYKIQLYNRKTSKLYIFDVLDLQTVNSSYTKALVTETYLRTEFSVDHPVEVNWDLDAEGSGGSGFSQVAYSTALTFATNQISSFGDVTDNSHTQSGAITFTYDFTGAVEGTQRIVQIKSDGSAINFPSPANQTGYIKSLDEEVTITGNSIVVEELSNVFIYFTYYNGYVNIDIKVINYSVYPETGLPFGQAVAISQEPSTDFYGSTGILKTSTGRLITWHDVFTNVGGSIETGKGYIYASDDDGVTFDVKYFGDIFWQNIFEQGSNLYCVYITGFIATGGDYLNGDIEMIYSTDDGDSWSAPVTLFSDDGTFRGYINAPTNVIERDGYIALGMGRRANTGGTFAESIEVGILYGDTTDLTNSANWSLSSFVAFDGAQLPSTIWTDTAETKFPRPQSVTKGHLEADIVYDGTNTYLHCRLEQTPNANYGLYYDVTWNSGNPPASVISTTPNYHEIAGGHVNNQIVWDATSSKYWSIVNWNRIRYANDSRKDLWLISSSDLDNWDIHQKVGGYVTTNDWETDIDSSGAQYATFIIDGDNLIAAYRVGTPDSTNAHDSDALTLTTIEDFRNIPVKTFVDGSLILDENSERLENVYGIGVIYDQSKYQNAAFMLDADNTSKVKWVGGFNFTGTEYMRIRYNEYLQLDNGTGLTVYFVVENLESTTNWRLMQFGDVGSFDTDPNNWYYATNIGLGVQNSRGVYSDTVVGNSYIFASSWDNTNEWIYNYINGANRGTPDSLNDATFVTDHIEVSTPYAGSYNSETWIGGRQIGSLLGFTSKIKAVHIIPSYTTPANVITYMNALNTIYSIY